MHVLLAGASRGVGLEIAKQLIAQKIQVTALVRSTLARQDLEQLGACALLGDALQAQELSDLIGSVLPLDAVISTIGGLPQLGERRPDYWGNKNLIDAAIKMVVPRFLLVTSIGAGNSVGALAPHVLEALAPVLAEKEKAEQYLIESGLIYTIIRPGGLKSEPPTHQAVLTEDPSFSGFIHRADVARLVCLCLQSTAAHHKILSAVDPSLIPPPRPIPPFQP